MPKEYDDLTPSAGELIGDCIISLERALSVDGGPISRTLADSILDNLIVAREYVARHTSRGFLRRAR